MHLFYMALGSDYGRIAESLSDVHLNICIDLWLSAIHSIRSIKLAEEIQAQQRKRSAVTKSLVDFQALSAARRRRNKCRITRWVGESCVNHAESLDFVLACMTQYYLRFNRRHVFWQALVYQSVDVPGWNPTDTLTAYPLPKGVSPDVATAQRIWQEKARKRMLGHLWTPPGNPSILFPTTTPV